MGVSLTSYQFKWFKSVCARDLLKTEDKACVGWAVMSVHSEVCLGLRHWDDRYSPLVAFLARVARHMALNTDELPRQISVLGLGVTQE